MSSSYTIFMHRGDVFPCNIKLTITSKQIWLLSGNCKRKVEHDWNEEPLDFNHN